MRHEVYKLCRDRLVPIAVVHLNVSLEECLANNYKRSVDQQVDKKAIERIFNCFESPKDSCICDRVHCTVVGLPHDLEKSAFDVVQNIQFGLREMRNHLVCEKMRMTANTEAIVTPETIGGTFDRRVRAAVAAVMITNTEREETLMSKPMLGQLLSKAKTIGQAKCKGGATLDEALAVFVDHVRKAMGPLEDKFLPALESALYPHKEQIKHTEETKDLNTMYLCCLN